VNLVQALSPWKRENTNVDVKEKRWFYTLDFTYGFPSATVSRDEAVEMIRNKDTRELYFNHFT
jgi:hypothetical protein